MGALYQVASSYLQRFEAPLMRVSEKGIAAVQRAFLPAASSHPALAIGSVVFNYLKLSVCYSSVWGLRHYIRSDIKKDRRLAALEITGSALLAIEMLRSTLSIVSEIAAGLNNKSTVALLGGSSKMLSYLPKASVALGVGTVAGSILLVAGGITSAITLFDAHYNCKLNGLTTEAGDMVLGSVTLAYRVGELALFLLRALG